VDRYSFGVELFHLLLQAGLPRRTLDHVHHRALVVVEVRQCILKVVVHLYLFVRRVSGRAAVPGWGWGWGRRWRSRRWRRWWRRRRSQTRIKVLRRGGKPPTPSSILLSHTRREN
jgi:hypothetical protein